MSVTHLRAVYQAQESAVVVLSEHAQREVQAIGNPAVALTFVSVFSYYLSRHPKVMSGRDISHYAVC